MATINLIRHHISSGMTIANSLKDRLDYGKNPDKTQDGELISAYECDHKTADAEFLLSKAKYKAITGREQKADANILCYQIRQAFKPGEIIPEQANKIGYELAMRWTKGQHAFFVATHVDRAHIHNHIYYNSTTLDSTRKFRDFKGSARAVMRLSDRICIENDLSVIINPKLKSQGKYKHYGQWLGDNKQPTFQERLRIQIDLCLAKKPQSMAAFLAIMSDAGYEHKYGRGGALSFRSEGQQNFTRLRSSTLGEGYDQDNIIDAIEGRKQRVASSKLPRTRKVNLIIDIQSHLQDGKGAAYEQWAKIFNLKQMAAALQYLKENNLMEYSELEEKTVSVTDRFHSLAGEIQKTEAAMSINTELKSAMVDYAKTRSVFDGYKAAKYSNKYLVEHEADIAIYRAAKATFSHVLSGGKLPKMDAVKAEWRELVEDKKSLYGQYRTAQKEMRDIMTVKANVDYLLGRTDEQKNKEQER